MNLHRSSGKPGWLEVAPGSRNLWQRTAARSNGYITPPNAATIVGFGLVLVGIIFLLDRQYIIAGILLLAGRFFDLVDGWLAEKTGTKSPFGEALDATVDKIATFLVLFTLPFTGVVPLWALLLIILPQIATSYVVLGARQRQKYTHPNLYGKLGIALAWIAIGGFVFLAGSEVKYDSLLHIASGLLAVVSSLFSVIALQGYLKEFAK